MSPFRSEAAERLLIGLLLWTGGRPLPRLRVRDEHLGDPRAVAILRAMHELAAAGRPIDLVTVWKAVEGVEGMCMFTATYLAACVTEADEAEVVDVRPLEAALLDARHRGELDSLAHALQVVARDPGSRLNAALPKLLAEFRRLARAAA